LCELIQKPEETQVPVHTTAAQVSDRDDGDDELEGAWRSTALPDGRTLYEHVASGRLTFERPLDE